MNESEQPRARDPYADEIDLRNLVSIVWSGKWLIISITTVAAIVSIIVALMLPNIYRAEALLAPNDGDGASGLSALAAQYGGLASLAGIDLGSASSDKTAMGLEVLKSRKFISEFIDRHRILVPLMAARDWDLESGVLEIDPEVYDVETERWVREVDPPRTAAPSSQEATEVFLEILQVRQDEDTRFVRVAVEFYSPEIARQWVDWLIEDLNASVMRQDVAEAEQAIEYLNEQILNTSLTELQSVFFRLIEEQTKTMLLARVSNEYLLKTIDPAVAPEEKARPTRSLIVILSTMFGGFVGLVGVFVIYGARN